MMRFTAAIIGGIFCTVAVTHSACSAEEASIQIIEEDWEIVLNEPDAGSVSPQITFFKSPSVNQDDTYFQLQMNYAADDGFSSGGFHVAAVQHGEIIDEARSDTRVVLSKDGDVIRWTSLMAVIDNVVLFAIAGGHGHDWGDFGGPKYLVKIMGTGIEDLSEYHPLESLNAVDIGFGANRVESITLREVRARYDDGKVVTVPINQHPQ